MDCTRRQPYWAYCLNPMSAPHPRPLPLCPLLARPKVPKRSPLRCPIQRWPSTMHPCLVHLYLLSHPSLPHTPGRIASLTWRWSRCPLLLPLLGSLLPLWPLKRQRNPCSSVLRPLRSSLQSQRTLWLIELSRPWLWAVLWLRI